MINGGALSGQMQNYMMSFVARGVLADTTSGQIAMVHVENNIWDVLDWSIFQTPLNDRVSLAMLGELA